ncbi:MAG: hypothetical protein GX946_05705 [Oligosphaeraceae bacterium]|mgnify:CR=1 FL=1|nr:hypothetical protein [Oligosphaeraceae bacterium]
MFFILLVTIFCALVFFGRARYSLEQAERSLQKAGYLGVRRSRLSLWMPFFCLALALLLSLFCFVESPRETGGAELMQVNVLLHSPEEISAEFEQAKQLLLQLRQYLPNWEFSLLSFADEALLDLPASSDPALWRQALAEVEPERWQGYGADLAKALHLAEQSMPPLPGCVQVHLVVLTSGFRAAAGGLDPAAWSACRWPCLVFCQNSPSAAELNALKRALANAKSPSRLICNNGDSAKFVADLAVTLQQMASAPITAVRLPGQRIVLLAAVALLALVLLSSDLDLPKVTMAKNMLLLPVCLVVGLQCAQGTELRQLQRRAIELGAETQNPDALLQAYESYRQILRMQPGDSHAAEGLEYSLMAWEQIKKEAQPSTGAATGGEKMTEMPSMPESSSTYNNDIEGGWQSQSTEETARQFIKGCGSWRSLQRRQKGRAAKPR